MPAELKATIRVSLERLFLDPNNPRLAATEKPGYGDPSKIFDDDAQIQLEIRMRRSYKGIKNLMGVTGGKRPELHHQLGQKMAEILSVIKPHLTIIDAYRVLVRNGPTGGNLKDVVTVRKVIASIDPVAADSYACTLKPFSLEGKNVSCVQAAYDMGLGEIDLAKMDIVEKII